MWFRLTHTIPYNHIPTPCRLSVIHMPQCVYHALTNTLMCLSGSAICASLSHRVLPTHTKLVNTHTELSEPF